MTDGPSAPSQSPLRDHLMRPTALIDEPHLPVSSSPWPRAKLTSLILALTTLSADLDSVLNSNDSTNGGC